MHSINTYSPSVISTNRIFDNTRRIFKQLHTSSVCGKNLVIIHSSSEALYVPWPIGLCMYRLSTLSSYSTSTHRTTRPIKFLVKITIQKAGVTTPCRNKLLAFHLGFCTSLTRIISEAYSLYAFNKHLFAERDFHKSHVRQHSTNFQTVTHEFILRQEPGDHSQFYWGVVRVMANRFVHVSSVNSFSLLTQRVHTQPPG